MEKITPKENKNTYIFNKLATYFSECSWGGAYQSTFYMAPFGELFCCCFFFSPTDKQNKREINEVRIQTFISVQSINPSLTSMISM